MKIKIELVIETDEAEPGEIASGVRDAISKLEMPNGDTLYLNDPTVLVKDVSA